jgi:hypothetical protein
MSAHHARRGVLAVLAALSTLLLAAPARADTVTDWNQIGATALTRDAGQGAVAIAHMAMIHGAVYDAVNAIDGRYEPYLVAPPSEPWYSQDAAAATAAYRVLVDSRPPLVPPAQQPALAASLKPLYDAALAAIPAGPAKDGGIATGNAAADAMIAARAGDGRFGPFRFTVGTLPGQWRPVLPSFVNDPGAWLKDVRPFLVADASRFAGRPPDAITSRRYTKDFNEVKTLGAIGSTTRTPDQTDAGRFWGAANGVATWNSLLRAIADGTGGSLADHARMFAMVYLASADGAITVWSDKAKYSFWRPITAIREAATDGNPETVADPGWLPLVATPPYPDQPSGLSALSGAAARALRDFFGTDDVAFVTTNSAGITRSYTSFSQVVREVVDARVWSGTHFRFADEQGARIGTSVARWADHHYFRPARDRNGQDDQDGAGGDSWDIG